jgi:glycosyltransferase involved in cell wall biosynthesis
MASATPTFSIVMPAYNAEAWIGAAIDSVLAQTRADWELIVVDDGSTDGTVAAVHARPDPRIRLMKGRHAGAAAARNIALEQVRGSLLCLLDADDLLTPDSLAARAAVFDAFPDTHIVDGVVHVMDATMRDTLRIYRPAFVGQPFHELVALSGKCFFGPTWMVRWPAEPAVRFTEQAPPAEDLLFALHYSAPGRNYRYTEAPVLLYRKTPNSSMTRLDRLERAYHFMHAWLKSRPELTSPWERWRFIRRARRFMAGAYWHAGRYGACVRSMLLRPRMTWWIQEGAEK